MRNAKFTTSLSFAGLHLLLRARTMAFRKALAAAAELPSARRPGRAVTVERVPRDDP